ncbi:MAG: winged helix-turn-helix transcriptional regulator, partial [Myxococcales bacterium]|nr:winged helix-turn-helix transcriptional regulator [Myxococcales bacterium]
TGLTAPAIVLTAAADAIEQRPALEPVVWSPPDGDLRIALERLSAGMRAPVLVLGPITVDLDRRSVAGTREERLTGLEARVLGYLAARRGRVIPKEELLAEVWGYRSSNTNTVPVMIGRIRKKIEVDHARPLWLLTARGGGYRLVHGPDGEPEGDVLPGRHEALRQATAALRDGRVWVSGPPGAGRAQLVRTLLAGRDVLWVTVHGTTTLPGLLEQLGVRLGQRLERLQDVAVEAVVLESADTLPADVVEAVAAGLEVPLVAIRTAPWACEGEVRLGPLEPHEAREHLVRLAATRGVALEDGVAGDLARRADGSVLALELIASWLPSVPAEALLHVLDEGLAHDDRVMAPVRAATGSLTPAERTALQGLAGFVGPFDRRTAARWLGPGVLHLGALERRGMVREDPTGLRVPPLVAAAVGPPDLERHDTKLLALVREVLPTLRTPTSELDGLAGLLPDLRATASRATRDDAVDVGRALTAVLALHGDYRSRLEVAEGALARCTTPETLARARVLLAENTRDH